MPPTLESKRRSESTRNILFTFLSHRNREQVNSWLLHKRKASPDSSSAEACFRLLGTLHSESFRSPARIRCRITNVSHATSGRSKFMCKQEFQPLRVPRCGEVEDCGVTSPMVASFCGMYIKCTCAWLSERFVSHTLTYA